MLEHVGLDGYAELGRILGRVLDARRGRGLLHFIGRNEPHPLSEWVERRIFPGAYPPTLGEAVRGVLEPAGVAVLDVENLRSHYVRTLDHWLQRFDAAGDRIAAMYGDAFVRAWRLYLAGSLASFSTGTLQLFQVLFARGGADGLAWTGRGRYADGGDR
jgi:cyclopropane-fatty-acyl-phospholipid synthase